MTIYFYAQTDNRLGLHRLRRTVALMQELKDFDTYLMTTEFRSATYAKRVLGVKKAVGIEDFRNVGTICERGDILVYDSSEHNEIIHQEMIEYFGKFFRISYNPDDTPKEGEYLISPHRVGERIINGILVDRRYFQSPQKSKRVFFYKDSDYEKELLAIAPKLQSFELELLEGFYFFVDIAQKVEPYFTKIYESEEYLDIVPKAKLFITHCAQSALEASASGSRVIYFGDDEEYLPLLQRVGVLHMGYFDVQKLQEALLSVKPAVNEYLQALTAQKVAKELITLL